MCIVLSASLQAQTFCPQFHYQHVLPISLDAGTLTALAGSDACVELWHHCPRSQAVAAALSRGLSSSYAMTGQQQVFLGSATLPLQGLLIHPQVHGAAQEVDGSSREGWDHADGAHAVMPEVEKHNLIVQHTVCLSTCACLDQNTT